jgi:hypothetical protein
VVLEFLEAEECLRGAEAERFGMGAVREVVKKELEVGFGKQLQSQPSAGASSKQGRSQGILQ